MRRARVAMAAVAGIAAWRQVQAKTDKLVAYQDYQEQYRGGKSLADTAFAPVMGAAAALGTWFASGLLGRLTRRFTR